MSEYFCQDNLVRYIGQTVTIFTKSGGMSGSGFTGVLLSVNNNNIRLLCEIGAAPSCPIGSSCCGCNSSRNNNFGFGFGFSGYGRNPFGSVAIIPISSIACFTHNAV